MRLRLERLVVDRIQVGTDVSFSRLRLAVRVSALVLVGIPISCMIVQYYRSWSQRDAIVKLRARGAHVGMLIGTFEPEVAHSCNLGSGRIGSPWCDADLELVAQLDTLEELNLGYTPITDKGVVRLAGLKHLKYLTLSGTRITDASAPSLASLPSLEALHLGDTEITDKTLQHLARLHKLSWVTVGNTRVTAEGIARLKECHSNRDLVVKGTGADRDSGDSGDTKR